MSKERPILFSGPMVRAILDGRKTQTRRALKYSQPKGCNGYWPSIVYGLPRLIVDGDRSNDKPLKCPYGVPGDRLWVPRWASRITLEVKAVRVERLQAMSHLDAIAEGIEGTEFAKRPAKLRETPHPVSVLAFAELWESTNWPESWDANPWVWVVEFERMVTSEQGAIHRGCGRTRRNDDHEHHRQARETEGS